MNDLFEISEEMHLEALACHRRAMTSARLIVEGFLDYARELKSINEKRYYKALGFETFGDYLSEYYDISDKTAYKYIAVYDQRTTLPDTLFSPGRKIEISKLYLLTTVPEEQRAELAESIDEVSKSELEAQIKDLKAENKRLEEEKQVTFDELTAAKEFSEKCGDEARSAKHEIASLKKDLKEAKKQKAEIIDLKGELKAANDKITELEARPPEIIKAEDTTEIDRLTKELEETKKQLSEAEKPEAIPDDKETFKAYLASAADAVKRLCEFVNSRTDSSNAELFRAKAGQLAELIRDKFGENV